MERGVRYLVFVFEELVQRQSLHEIERLDVEHPRVPDLLHEEGHELGLQVLGQVVEQVVDGVRDPFLLALAHSSAPHQIDVLFAEPGARRGTKRSGLV